MNAQSRLGELAEETLNTIRQRRHRYRRQNWSEDDLEILRRRYPDELTQIIALELDRPLNSVLAKANALGLHKSTAFFAGPHAGRLTAGTGITNRFEKGHTPWNIGMKGFQAGGRAKQTQFKPGSKPHTWKPLGSERISRDGYLQRKVTDTGYPPKDWVGVHILLWIEAHGPVPQGHNVTFRDGNKQHLQLDNLELLSRAEMMKRNTIHRFPPALKDTIRAVNKLKRAIKESTDEK